ncbi:MAG TPA: hypothetical protein VK502_03060 [Candidatus Saccharimonadales bacterium]|nr:hypothetical protein [Candidatus Saccharimonadales bacterium]
MNATSPVIFADGTEFYTALASIYKTHPRGLFILAPSGTGKTYFVTAQREKHWIDGDYLWPATNADLNTDEWNNDQESVEEINRRSDVITAQVKKLGFWVVGSSNDSLKPDAIVIPPWRTHREYIRKREGKEYDGGAKSEDFKAVLAHRKIIKKWQKKGVPCFNSIEEAADFLARGIKV